MEAYEREYHDTSSDFDDRIELEEVYSDPEEEEEMVFKDEENFYRHLEEY